MGVEALALRAGEVDEVQPGERGQAFLQRYVAKGIKLLFHICMYVYIYIWNYIYIYTYTYIYIYGPVFRVATPPPPPIWYGSPRTPPPPPPPRDPEPPDPVTYGPTPTSTP